VRAQVASEEPDSELDGLLTALGAPSAADIADAPARHVAAAAAELVQQAFSLHHLLEAAECNREELLLGDLCLVSAAELVAGLGRADVEAEFSRAAMAASTGASPTSHLERAVELAGLPAPAALPASTADGGGDESGMLERRLEEILAADPEAVSRPMADLLHAGGKRLRPRLSFLWSSLGPRHAPAAAATLGCVFEFIHDAALVHDDIVDDSPMRRGKPAVHVAYGAGTAVRVGDYYFGRAAELLAGLGSHEVTRIAIDAVVRVCRAQLEEYRSRAGEPVDEARYLRTVEGKTAALFSGACAAGAALAGCDDSVVDAAAAYGLELGIAFQVADDLIDFLPTSGKPLAQDLRQGVTSLPLLYALRDPKVGPELQELVAAADVDGDRAARLVRESGAMERARALAETYRDRALTRLAAVPAGAVRDQLSEIATQAVTRES